MKKVMLIAVFLTALMAKSSAQSYAIINDSDGYVNVRQSPSINAQVMGKLDDGTILVMDDEDPSIKSDWVKMDITLGAGIAGGYVHKSRILLMLSMKKILNVKYGDNFCTAKNDSISIKINSAKFVANNHIIKGTPNRYEKIDGKHIWGTDGMLPKRAIASVSIKIHGQLVAIPKSVFKDLYEPNFRTFSVYFGPGNTLYLELYNGDGAGGYTVIWVIKNNKFEKRYLDMSFA